MSESLPLEFRADVPRALRASLTVLLQGQRTLEDVVRWGLEQRPALLVAGVVVQDEYTHDVVVPHDSGLWLVYDAT